ncbi:MAG: ZIP family metal transporter [Clostridia bacterium]|nr:ZIP family metal transporter [Clostridia bacterium]
MTWKKNNFSSCKYCTTSPFCAYADGEVIDLDHVVWPALGATLFTWSLTALGAATVIFFRKVSDTLMNTLLGFASGVMIAASFWSLLLPAIERADTTLSVPAWLVAAGGFLSGAVFMWAVDTLLRFARRSTTLPGIPSSGRGQRILLLVLSMTLHNIPEGLAVGVAFGALYRSGYDPEALMGAITIAMGIGLQNFPEGAAVSLPLRREGVSRLKSFAVGQSSGMVEPVAGVLGALLVVYVEPLLPFALAFAAGTMILVTVHELIPECQQNRDATPYASTMGIILGFAVMMVLDVAFG